MQRESSLTLSKAHFSRVFPLIFKISKFSPHKLLIKQSQFTKVSNGVVHVDSSDVVPQNVVEDLTIEDSSFIDCGSNDSALFYTSSASGTSLSFIIIGSYFQDIVSTTNASVAYLQSCNVNISDTTFVNCSGSKAGIAIFESCESVLLSDINVTNCQANGTEMIADGFQFVSCVVNITGFTISNPNTTTTGNSIISISDGYYSSIKYGLFSPQSSSKCLSYTDSMNNELYSIGFANITEEPINISGSNLIAKHLCKDNSTLNYTTNSDDVIIIYSDINFTDYCDYDEVKAPTTPTATKISKSEKTAAIVTLVFFIIFFVAVFVTLISLVFCKVGLSEELTFSGSQSFEEDSFESFAN